MRVILTMSGTLNPAHLLTLVTPVEIGLDVTRFAEEFLPEDDIVQADCEMADRALETVLVPGEDLPALRVHLDSACSKQSTPRTSPGLLASLHSPFPLSSTLQW